MAKYHFNPKELIKGLNPSQLGLRYISTQRIELGPAKKPLKINSKNLELCFIPISGDVEYKINGVDGTIKKMDILYLPWKTTTILTSKNPSVCMMFAAPSDRPTDLAIIHFEDIARHPTRKAVYGSAEKNCLRTVYHYLDDQFKACRLMVGICQGSTGGWTSWPPHEHATKREEVYLYFDMGEAFGVQCVYEKMDKPMFVGMVRDGDLVSIPRGFHPNVGCSGGRISFIYVMAAKKAGDRNFMDLTVQKEFGDKFN